MGSTTLGGDGNVFRAYSCGGVHKTQELLWKESIYVLGVLQKKSALIWLLDEFQHLYCPFESSAWCTKK